MSVQNIEIEIEEMPAETIRGNVAFADYMLSRGVDEETQNALLDVRNKWTDELKRRGGPLVMRFFVDSSGSQFEGTPAFSEMVTVSVESGDVGGENSAYYFADAIRGALLSFYDGATVGLIPDGGTDRKQG